MGVEAIQRHHVQPGAQVPFDEAGDEGQLPGKAIIVIIGCIDRSIISLRDGLRVAEGAVGHGAQVAKLLAVKAVRQVERIVKLPVLGDLV